MKVQFWHTEILFKRRTEDEDPRQDCLDEIVDYNEETESRIKAMEPNQFAIVTDEEDKEIRQHHVRCGKLYTY